MSSAAWTGPKNGLLRKRQAPPAKWGISRLCAAKSAGFAVPTSHLYEALLIRFSILAIEARIVSKAGGSAKIIAWVFS
jgi:hypothetical protein